MTREQEEIAKDPIKGEFGEKAILRAQTPAMTRKGETFRLTKENLMERLTKQINKAHDWSLLHIRLPLLQREEKTPTFSG